MKHIPLARLLRFTAWLLLPILTALWILQQSPIQVPPQSPLSLPAAPQVQAPGPTHPVSVQLFHADGTPATDGVVFFFSPELVSANVDAKGFAQAEMEAVGPLRFFAFAPLHNLLEGQQETPLPANNQSFRLSLLQEPEIESVEEPSLLPRHLVLLDSMKRPMANSLVLARVAEQPESEPWIAFSDTEGKVVFDSTYRAELLIEVYVPGLPPRQATRLYQGLLNADQKQASLSIPGCFLQVHNLPPQELFIWKRLDLNQLLPMVPTPDAGVLSLGPIPPGRYRLEVNRRVLEVQGIPGFQDVDFSKATVPIY